MIIYCTQLDGVLSVVLRLIVESGLVERLRHVRVLHTAVLVICNQ